MWFLESTQSDFAIRFCAFRSTAFSAHMCTSTIECNPTTTIAWCSHPDSNLYFPYISRLSVGPRNGAFVCLTEFNNASRLRWSSKEVVPDPLEPTYSRTVYQSDELWIDFYQACGDTQHSDVAWIYYLLICIKETRIYESYRRRGEPCIRQWIQDRHSKDEI
jgi:hypothetical protein